MSLNDSFCSISRTLCNSTHKSVLIKNALQCQQELSRLGLGSPKALATDMTLCYGPSFRARMMDLQPLNDPFVVDNIFKSPKKRRRGLLSWGMPPPGDACGEKPAASVVLWGFSRHVRARNRRRSIMGSKYSLSSMRRRRLHTGNGGEHTRSASDPTAALSPLPPKDADSPRHSPRASAPASPNAAWLARPYIARTPLPGSDAAHIAQTPSPCRVSPEPRPPPLLAFPRLPESASIRSPSDYRRSDSFGALSPRSCCASSTLRGVPGHPAVLRLASEREFCTSVAPPMPAHLRGSDRLPAQRCSSLPCAPPLDDVPAPAWAEGGPVRVVFDPARQEEAPGWPTSRPPFDVAGPTRFARVKNSLDIRQPAPPCARPRERRCPQVPSSPSRRSAQLPPAMRVLQWLAACGSSRKY
ncbi:hypothetical protein IWQ57_000551 [Coemansia nantahalensis]|uniref:Uncharacterized protein n=1 Tax=Coemansia nantahalensis TaxID=2789366 RepID=A0ACC1K757_9FUNG|nr:hypothetical protein IWQ57_000551 [Coemansia nantahalensis]